LFFELAPRAAILGDSNRELIEVFQVVRNEPEAIYNRLRRLRRDLETYLRWRSLEPKNLDRSTRALRFIYLNRNCFNGIYRTNTKGHFNVPMGKRPGQYFSREDLLLCAELLQNARFVTGDFTETLLRARAGDFVYLDPPYAVGSRRVFKEYGKDAFTIDDVPRLATALHKLHKLGAKFLVSYADCREARTLAKDWNSRRFPTKRHVAGFAGARRHAYELEITNLPQHS
jgi:DNA adenine methylase